MSKRWIKNLFVSTTASKKINMLPMYNVNEVLNEKVFYVNKKSWRCTKKYFMSTKTRWFGTKKNKNLLKKVVNFFRLLHYTISVNPLFIVPQTLLSRQFVLLPINQHDNSDKKTCQGLYLLFQLLWIYDELLVLFWTNYISAPDCASPIGRRFGRRHLTISISLIFKDAGWHYTISRNIGSIQV